MAEQHHGRYYAQELLIDRNANIREQIQEALDAGENNNWELVGASGVGAKEGSADRSVILFWDTVRPSFGIGAPSG